MSVGHITSAAVVVLQPRRKIYAPEGLNIPGLTSVYKGRFCCMATHSDDVVNVEPYDE